MIRKMETFDHFVLHMLFCMARQGVCSAFIQMLSLSGEIYGMLF